MIINDKHDTMTLYDPSLLHREAIQMSYPDRLTVKPPVCVAAQQRTGWGRGIRARLATFGT
jgi:hypothetical protein